MVIKLNIGLATVPLGSTAHRSWHMQPNENELFLWDISQRRMPLLLRQYGMVALRGDGQVMRTGSLRHHSCWKRLHQRGTFRCARLALC